VYDRPTMTNPYRKLLTQPPPLDRRPRNYRALRTALAGALLAGAGAAVCGCAAAPLIVDGVEQAACAIIPEFLPNSTTLVAAVCKDVEPAVNGIVAAVVAESGGATATAASINVSVCRLVPITDGSTRQGAICSAFCGDMSTATAADPCPRVDTALKASKASKAAKVAPKPVAGAVGS